MNTDKEKDPTKLTAEELEKRVAPMALTYSDPVADPTEAPTTSPTTSTSGHHQGQTGGGGGGKLNQ